MGNCVKPSEDDTRQAKSSCESIQSSVANPDLRRAAAKSPASFALELFKQVSNKSDANVFMSPFSISVAMAMTYLGARGNTQRQMKDALGFKDMDDAEMHASTCALISSLKDTFCAYTLRMANRLYGDNSHKFDGEYIRQSKKYYGTAMAAVDFR